MSSPVLTAGSTVVCGHTPPTPTPPGSPVPGLITMPHSSRLTVTSHGITQGVLPVPATPQQAKNCALTGVTGATPCQAVAVAGPGAVRLHVDGVPVLLEKPFNATTTGGPPPTTPKATANQAVLTAT